MQMRTRMGVRRYWCDSFSLLNQIKQLRRNIRLDDMSYEFASENVNTNNMQSRIHLEKATRKKVSCLFWKAILIPSQSSYKALIFIFRTSIFFFFFIVSGSRCAIHLFTVAPKRQPEQSPRVRKTWLLML